MRKKLLLGLLSVCFVATSAFAFISCDNNMGEQSGFTQMDQAYAQYIVYAQAEGVEPLSYEDWLATIKGEKGESLGKDGKSAYQIWLDSGNEGTEEDFLNWLKGKDGKSAYQIWLDNGNEGTEEDFLNWLKGESVGHSFGEWSCLGQGENCEANIFLRVCSICSIIEWRMGTEDDHIWNTEYSYNKTYHWIECESCGMAKDFETHATNSLGVCLQCGINTKEVQDNINSNGVDVVAYDGSAVTVTFYHCMGADLRKILDTYIEDFNDIYPNITIQHDSFGDYNGTRDQIKTELNNGNSPTIAYCYPDHVALYNNAKAVMPLDGYINSTLSATESAWSPEGTLGFTATQKADFIQAYYNEGKEFGDGLMYTLPYQKSTEVLYYNKTMFEQKGWEVPTTWTEMEALCEVIKAEYPNDIPLGYDSEANLFINLAKQYNSPYTSTTKGSYFQFNNEVNRGFAQMLRDWYNKGYLLTKQTYSGKYMSDLFKATGTSQKAYMCIGSTAGATYQGPAKNNDGSYPFEVGVAAIPQVNPANAKVISQGPSLCMFKKSAQECAAGWLFLKFLTTYVPLQAECSMKNGYTPVINSVFENETYQNEFLKKADGNAYLQATVIKKTIELQNAFFTTPAFNGSSAARDEMETLITNVLLKKDSIQSIFDDAIENLAYDYGY